MFVCARFYRERRFVRFIGFKKRITNTLQNVTINSFLVYLQLNTLSVRREIIDNMFFSYKYILLNDIISCFPPFEHIPCEIIHVEIHLTYYGQHSPLNRLFTEGNLSNLDFFFLIVYPKAPLLELLTMVVSIHSVIIIIRINSVHNHIYVR